ncbi:MAG TPA: peptidoglycan-binding domain-containing protein [Solirubrobacteraceae bacterium]|nr:peptidoglycan-binding domain-containing protein [Solirubrobacteraceae bacterium]
MRGKRLAALAAVLLAAIVVVAVLLDSGAAPKSSAGTGVPAGQTTTEVTRRTLTESSTVDGTLGYGATLELYDRLSGTFTWLPAVGAIVRRGGTLWRVNNLPVVLMYGSVPAYRTLKEGVSDGPDVTELNENLIALGYEPYGEIVDDEDFSAATAAAVRRFQRAEGLSETGKVELGRVVFAPGARRVTAVKVALGQDPPGEPAAKEPAAKEAAKEPAGSKDSGEPGAAAAGAGMVALSTTSTRQLVTLKLKAEQQTLARVGESAPVTLPGDRVVRGRITEVGTVAEAKASEPGGEKGGSQSGESEAATIAVTLALEHPVAHLDEAPVSVELVKSIRHDVLTVPATALTATAGGGYAIETLKNGRSATLAVTPGMFADGYVQVEGPGVREGLTVIESE